MGASLKEQFLNYMERQKRCSMLTLRNYQTDIAMLERWLEHLYDEPRAIESATTDDIRLWIIDRLDREGISPASMNRALATFRSMYKWGVTRKLVEVNPMRAIQPLKVGRKLPQFIPRAKINDVIPSENPSETVGYGWDQYIEDRNEMILQFLYFTGLRLSELASLSPASFNSDYTTLRVVGKGGKERIVPIASALRSKLFAYLQKFISLNICISSFNSLFLTKRRSSLSTSMIYTIVRRELALRGVDGRKSPHIMRHTFATHLLNEGVEIRVIQELLGHSSLNATQRYTHNSIKTLKSTYQNSHPRGMTADACDEEGK